MRELVARAQRLAAVVLVIEGVLELLARTVRPIDQLLSPAWAFEPILTASPAAAPGSASAVP